MLKNFSEHLNILVIYCALGRTKLWFDWNGFSFFKERKLSWSRILIMFYPTIVSFIGVLPITNLWDFKEMTNYIPLIPVFAICNWHIAKVELIIWLIEICFSNGISSWVVSVFLGIILVYLFFMPAETIYNLTLTLLHFYLYFIVFFYWLSFFVFLTLIIWN